MRPNEVCWVGTAVCALALAAAPRAARADEVVERYDDGTVRVRYAVDAEGRRQGTYIENHPNGKPRVKARYVEDRLEGAYAEHHENGRVALKARYVDGAIEGTLTRHDEDGKVLAEEEWIGGKLIHPRPRKWIDKELKAIYKAKVDRPPAPADPVQFEPQSHARQTAALRRLRAYRYLCGVPHEDLGLSHEYGELTSAAAKLLDVLGYLTHEPKMQPDGVSDALWAAGKEGLAKSNIATVGASSVKSVDFFMWDSDAANIARVGHRRWCLNPRMTKTAFGLHDGWTTMYAADESRARGDPVPPTIAYPAAGFFPADHIMAGAAWSLLLDRARFADPTADGVKVTVRPAAEKTYEPGEPVEIAHFSVDAPTYGYGAAIIFRPAVKLAKGERYWVKIEGVKTKDGQDYPVEYLVELY